MQVALRFRDECERLLPPTIRWSSGNVRSNTGIVGVTETYSTNRNGTISPIFGVSWYDEHGKHRNKTFSINKHGREKALEMAIAFRKEKERIRLGYDFESTEAHIEKTDKMWEQISTAFTYTLPEEVEDDEYFEGAVRRIYVNIYERNPQARLECITHYGTECFVCGFNFTEKYGELGKGLIHVHHLKSLSEVGEEYQVDPIKDMRPICPNCHAIVHRKRPAYTIEHVTEHLHKK